MVTVKGIVLKGRGQGATYVRLPWFQRQIRETFGINPHPGTLNLKLSEEDFSNLATALKKIRPFEIVPKKGYCQASCYETRLNHEIACVLIIPQVRNYPINMIEIIAEHSIKEKHKIKDGDIVDVQVK